MTQLLSSELTPDPNLRPPKAATRRWYSLAAAITRPARWSRLTVALNIVGQLGLLVVTGKWPLQPPTRNTMRGIDFYPWRDLLRALTNGALIFKAEEWLFAMVGFPD